MPVSVHICDGRLCECVCEWGGGDVNGADFDIIRFRLKQ